MDPTTAATEVNPLDALDEAAAPDAAVPELPQAPGRVSPGTISDVWHRPVLHNDDGSISTTLSFSIGTDKGETLIPQVVDGHKLTREEAIDHYRKTGEHLGVFDTPEHADTYAQALHNAQWDYIKRTGQSQDVNPLDALDSVDPSHYTSTAMTSALQQTGEPLPEVTVSARRGPEATWSDVGSALLPTIGAKIESKLAGAEEYRGNETYSSARKKLWQSMVLPEAVRNARDKGIPLTEDDRVVDIARHLGIRPDVFTRDWPDYANQTDAERRDFQAAQRQRIRDAQPLMQEGETRRKKAAQVAEDVRPNMRGIGLKSIAFDAASMIPDLLAGTAATLATGPVGGAAFMAADIAPDEYAAARNQGLDHRHAETYATLSTLASSVPEIPVFKILDSAPAAKKIIGGIVGETFGATAPGKVIGTSVAQGVTQATVQALQEGIDEGLLDRHDTLPEALKKIAAAGLTGAVVGAPMGGVHAALHREPKPTTLLDSSAAGETPPGPSGLEAAAAAAGPSTEQAAGAPPGGNRAEAVNPEVNRGEAYAPDAPISPHHAAEPEVPAQAEGALPAQRPIPALIQPGQAPLSVLTDESGKGRAVSKKTAGEAELGNEPAKLTGADLRAALKAVEDKTVSPPQLEALEGMKLATRNDVNVPRLLPAGRRELAKTVPEAPQPVDLTARGQVATPESTEIAPEKAQNGPEIGKREPTGLIEPEKQAEVGQIDAKRGRPAVEQSGLPGNRLLEDKALRHALEGMKQETGWAQVGGRVLRNEETGAVTGRTTWIPNAEWWPDRPKGLTEPQVHKAVDKALAGEKLSPREQKMVEFMRDVHDQRQKLNTYLPEPADMPADYDLGDSNTVPVDDAHETAMVARLADIDEGALESYAKQHEDNRQGFLRAVKNHLDAYDREAARAGSESREEAASVAEDKKSLDLFGQDTSRQQELADEIRRRDQSRSPNKEVSADVGRPGDLFSRNANQQIDLVSQLERARKQTNTAPTEAQKVSGNYKKGTVSFGGMRVAIENPAGSTRTGTSDGKAWRRKMHADYGYVKGTEGSDGDAVDVFLTGNPDTGKVFVINQNHADGTFDEHKAILGASSKEEAESTYLKHYPKDWKGMGSTVELSTEAFKEWVNSKKAKQPIRANERRIDAAKRKRVTEMTSEEMRKELLEHELTGIANRRAYVEAEKLPTQVSIDVDSLKWVNDNMGHESGDALLKAIADSLSQHSDLVYHLSGDEFALQALHQREADEVMAKVAEQLKGATIEVEMPDGKIVKLNGLGVSYGVGKDLHEADAALQSHKQRREKEGHRAARGEAPPGATVGAREEGRENKARGASQENLTVQQRGMQDRALAVAKEFGIPVTEDNELVLYHGTRRAAAIRQSGTIKRGSYLTGDKATARDFSKGGEVMRVVVPAHMLFDSGPHDKPYFSLNEDAPLREGWTSNKEGGVAEERATLTTAQQRTADRLNELLAGAARRQAMEERGQELLDEMDEKGIHPRDVAKQFWDETYWKLNAENQRRFQRYVKSMGFQPGDTTASYADGRREVAQDWHDAAKVINDDLPAAEYLEGIDRGYVALMKWANDQAAGLSQGDGERLMLKEDEAKYSPLSPVTGGVEDRRTEVAPGQRSLDLFAPRDNPTPAARAARKLEAEQPKAVASSRPGAAKARTALVRTGHFTSGIKRIRDWHDAAHILAPLRKEPRESLMAVVTDEAGKPLAIIRHTTGTTSQSLVELHTLLGAIARVPGAREFYLGHNHPSGQVDQSTADKIATSSLLSLTRNTGLELKGSIVVGPGNKHASLYDPEIGQEIEPITAASRHEGLEVPIQERRYTRIPPHAESAVSDEAQAVQAIKDTKTASGVLLLDSKLQLIGHIPLSAEEMSKLRTGNSKTGAIDILRQFSDANATQAITFGESSPALANLGALLNQAKIELVATVKHKDGKFSILNSPLKGVHFNARRETPTAGMPVQHLEHVVRQTIRESGLGDRFPHVAVHANKDSLPTHLREQLTASSGGQDSAIFDPRTNRIHMLADGNATELEARANLWHEAVGHYGLRAALDPARYNEVMDGLYRDMPERVQQTAYRNGLDLNDPTERRVAAEEVIAYAAGQILTGQDVDKPLVPYWTKVARAVKAFFAKITGTPFYDERAIAGLVQEAQTALERGTSLNGLSEGAVRSQHAERFYSPVERAIGESKQAKASADQWLATIKKTSGVKPEELQWLDLENWLKGHKGPISKEELADYVRANRLDLEETVHGGDGQTEQQRALVRAAEKLRARGYAVEFDENGYAYHVTMTNDARRRRGVIHRDRYFIDDPVDRQEAPDEIRAEVQELHNLNKAVESDRGIQVPGYHETTQYSDYTLPGGQNYREMLLRLPEKTDATVNRRTLPEHEPDIDEHDIETLPQQARRLGNFRSSHWNEPNILAHVRFNERTDADGKRVLFLEELQSDWHQAGRKNGYRSDEVRVPTTVNEKYAGHRYWEVLDQHGNFLTNVTDQSIHSPEAAIQEARERLRSAPQSIAAPKQVPDAPFKTSWPMLIMKRMVRWAAENGFERIAWTTGDQQNERYSLEHHVQRMDVRRHRNPAGERLYSLNPRYDEGGSIPGFDRLIPEAELEDYVGQELAKRLRDGPDEHTYSGIDLRTGGEGMRGFYDDILPRETDKLIKKYGAKVGQVDLGKAKHHVVEDEDGNFVTLPSQEAAHSYLEGVDGAYQGVEIAQLPTVHGFDVTPEMRNAALSQGFPLFARRQAALPLQQPGPKGVYERIRKAVDWLMENPVTRDIRKLTSPTNLSAESKQAARVAREYLGAQAAWGQRSQEALEHFAREIDKWPVADQLQMMDHIEQGLPQPHPELQPAADGMRQMLDHWRDEVRGLGTGALDNFIENYFPHYWADPGDAKRLVASIQGRRPLKGPATFLKLRTIPTIKEGMDAGLKPLTVNPLVMTLLKTREMQRFITGVTLMKRFKEDGLAVFLKSGRPMPDGWAPINDNSAKVRSWSEDEGGWIERGQYIMPEDAARVINNHVSQSWLKSFAPAQAFRIGANLLNALQLGFSAFHLGFTTLDAIISKTALGMESLLHGEVGKAARNFGEVALGPLAAVNNVRRGHQLLNAYTNPVGATPELAKIVKALEVAGGRAHMDKYYMLSEGASPFRGVGVRSLAKDIHSALTQPTHRIRNVGQAVHNFAPEYATKLLRGLQALGKTHTPLEIPFEVAGRLVRASTSWIMEHLVPMQKLGVFSDLAKAHIDRHPNENPNDQADSLQRIWASVDNRLGEMVYDNLFWDRTFKDVLHFGIRAVGWNVGTVREIAGAPVDAVKMIDKAIRTGQISADDVGHKIPYVLAMTMTTALYGAITNYLFTGEPPKELKDYFFPRTGGETNYGTPQRVSLPSYVKDVYEYSQRPGHTVMNKLNPIFNVIGEMWNNEDFFGNPITDPDAGFWKSLEQRAGFVVKEATPFSLQGAQQLAGSEKPGFVGGVKRIGPYVGITPAPGYVTSPDQMERRERSEREKKYASHLKYLMNKAVAAKDTKEIERLRKEYIDAAINAKKTQIEVDKDKARSAVSRRKAATSMRQQGFPATANLVASLPLEPDAAARQYFLEQATA